MATLTLLAREITTSDAVADEVGTGADLPARAVARAAQRIAPPSPIPAEVMRETAALSSKAHVAWADPRAADAPTVIRA